jgi:nucleotide-binding universal stress UspA family protein
MKRADRSFAPAFGVIIAGTDGSDRSVPAIQWAADEAVRRAHVLRIVHTVPWLYGAPTDPGAGVVPDEDIARGRKVLEQAVSLAREHAPDVTVESELMVGGAAAVLLERARTGAMVVVGAHGTGLTARLPIGSTALQVITHTPVPAVVVREPEPGSWHEVTVGVDEGRSEESAVRFAFEEAALRKARLRAIHVWSHPSPDRPGDMQPLVYDAAVVEEEEQRVLDEALAAWREEFPDVEVCCEAVYGRPARILAGASARSDLLVVGTRGRGGFAGLLLGSVSHAMLHSAHCPVVVVPSVTRQEEP